MRGIGNSVPHGWEQSWREERQGLCEPELGEGVAAWLQRAKELKLGFTQDVWQPLRNTRWSLSLCPPTSVKFSLPSRFDQGHREGTMAQDVHCPYRSARREIGEVASH